MTDESFKASKRALDPGARISEALFGLIMVLTFTCSLSVAGSGREDVREMLIGALGCNFAWGIIDAIFYLMGCLGEKGQGLRVLRALRKTATPDAARHLIADQLPPIVAASLEPSEYEALRQRLLELPEPPSRPRLDKDEWLGALSVFLWVVTTTFPVTIPFIFMSELGQAMRVSNAIAIVLLFITGISFGRFAGYRPALTGLAMVVFGSVLVAFTIALGG
jgi:VIT1/CCC1 family predicted Fe2+/Mn2+ transporter